MRRLTTLLIAATLCGAPATPPAFGAAEVGGAPQKEGVVEAAKANKAKRKASSTKVITNADVKKSKGKLIAKPAGTKAATPPDEKKPVTLAQHDARYKSRVEASEKVAAGEKKVATLEKDLDAIEQRYYEENDPTYRDTVIQKRFAQTRRQLEDARRELADARDSLQKAEAPLP